MKSHAKAPSVGSNQRQASRLGRTGIAFACILALLACSGIGASSAEAASRAKLGEIPAVGGAGAGNLLNPRSVAANRTGAGGADAGDVYVIDSNNRVSQFSATGTFVRAWGWNVVSSGPDNVTPNERQIVTLDSKSDGGTFTLSLTGTAPTTTAAIARMASASEVETALATLGSIGSAANVDVTGANGGPWTVEFVGTLAATNVNQITLPSAGLALTAAIGSQLTCASTTVSDNTEFRWLSSGAPATGTGANTATYTVHASDAGKAVQCQVIKSNSANGVGSTQVSNPAIVVTTPSGAIPSAPTGTIASPSGTVTEGQVLTCNAGTWSNSPTSFTYTWLKNGTTVLETETKAATSDTYTLLAADVAAPANFQCLVTGTNANGSVSKASLNKATGTPPGPPAPAAPGGVSGSPNVSVPLLSASVETRTEGAVAFEICAAGTTPVNVCQAGEASSRGGSVRNPGGIAVDQETGNVYVFSIDNRRVDVFSATGTFQGAFGWKVKAGAEAAAALQFCTTSGTGCAEGEATASAGGFANNTAPRNLAVGEDGNLYVPGAGNARFDVFAPTVNGSDEVTGVSFLRAIGWKVNVTAPLEELQECTTATGCQAGSPGAGAGQFTASNPTTVAVDSGGAIYAVSSGSCSPTAPCRIQKFNPAGTIADANFGPETGECIATRTGAEAPASNFTTGPTGRGVQAVAVDPATGNVLTLQRTLGTAAKLCELDPSTGEFLSVSPPSSLTVGTGAAAGLALGTGERVYLANGAPAVHILGPVPPSEAELLPTTDIDQTSAKLNGKVTVPAPGGPGFETTYRFEVSNDNGASWTSVPDSDVSIGNGEAGGASSTCPTPQATVCTVSQTATGLQPNLNHRVRLVATTGPSATSPDAVFKTLPAPPTVDYSNVAPLVTESSAKLKGIVNPNNSSTSYRFEWGTSTSYGNQSPDFEPFIGDGGEPLTVTANLGSLKPATTYHYRVVATNTAGGTTEGEDRQLTTAEARQELNAAGLPDNRGFELVSPADKGPAGSVSEFFFVSQMNLEASEDGDAFVYPIVNGLPDSSAGGWTRWRAERTGEGWLSEEISAPSLLPTPYLDGSGFALPSHVYHASPDLGCAILLSYNPLTADTPQESIDAGMENLYRWNADDGSYDLITNVVPTNPEFKADEAYYNQIQTSDDCSRVYFRTRYQLIPGVNPEPDEFGLYEWDEGTLRYAGALPDGSIGLKMPGSAQLGRAVAGGEVNTNGTASWNAVSPDGSRLFFTAIANQGPSAGKPAIFMREDGGASVTEISQSETAAPTNGARFEAASPDGKRVFFRANYGIDAEGSSVGSTGQACGPLASETSEGIYPPVEQKPCDLYVYEVESGELTDLSADANPADPIGAAIQGMVAVDEDGSHVYFAALGQLIPGKGRTYAENVAGDGSANVYLAHDGELDYVTTLSRIVQVGGFDGGDLFGAQEGDNGVLMRKPARWNVETSADGSRLVFESRASLTGHDLDGGKAVYLYSAETGGIACLSCPPGGGPPLAKPNTETEMLASPRSIALTGRTRAMSEDGSRIFFTSPDVLAPGAVAGKLNVYEWSNDQVYFLVTAIPSGGDGIGRYLDASASGGDVFIATNQQLVPQDKDFVADVYDVRVDGGFPFAEPPPECQVDEAVPLLPNQIYCQGDPTPQPGAPAPASAGFQGAGNPPQGKPRPRPRCAKGKVRRRGKCVKRPQRAAKRKRAANANRGGVQ